VAECAWGCIRDAAIEKRKGEVELGVRMHKVGGPARGPTDGTGTGKRVTGRGFVWSDPPTGGERRAPRPPSQRDSREGKAGMGVASAVSPRGALEGDLRRNGRGTRVGMVPG
jgi:hypothetical protein